MNPRRLVAVGLASASLTLAFADDSLDQRLRAFGKATDCGRVGADGANRAVVNRCVRENFTANRPFFARYDLRGEDSTLATGIVLEPLGGVVVISFDSIACTPSNCEKWCGTVAHQCLSPKLIDEGNGRLRLRCKDEYAL